MNVNEKMTNDHDFNRIMQARLQLSSLSVYRGLAEEKLISGLISIFHDIDCNHADINQFISHYSDFCYHLSMADPEADLGEYIIDKIACSDNAFTRQCENVPFADISGHLRKAAERDLDCIQNAVSLTARDIKAAALKKFGESELCRDIVEGLSEWEFLNRGGSDDILSAFKTNSKWSECAGNLADHYRQNGSGEFVKYKGFIWEKRGAEGHLRGIERPDPVRFSDLIGYEAERGEVINNTLQFLQGSPANNVLLYGNRGTGKSSTVKALLNEYGHLGLRLIELPKAFLKDLPELLRTIESRKQKFIIFIDDLAFDDSEEEYTGLKAVLEGGLESKPPNVIIYATSNRRHLIKERFSDRTGLIPGSDDEVHAADTMQEKLSLADRFGITVTFSSPDKKRYLEIVDGLAKSRDLVIDTEALHREAQIWEMQYNGRSGRTARQFIDWMEGRMKTGRTGN